ncbi:MAG: alpha-ketoacid dehydrogenase subunit beta [Spirochaetales bacterium]|nr:alpha-ketoacid dehydrogenase subunit beta [Spirochaetales bacterium]
MREITYAQAVREAMCEEMRSDNDVIFMGEDIGVYGGAFGVSRGMIEEFGSERVLETPISELAITGCAAGAAMTGLRPIVEIMFSDFITLSMEPLVNQAAKNRYQFGGQASVPMVLRTPGGSGTGAAAQHSQSLEAWVAHVPGIKVVVPSTPYDAKGLLKAAIRDNNPVVVFEQKMLYRTKGAVPDDDYIVPLGQADVKRSGSDVSIITYGRMVQRSIDAAKQLSLEGISVEVIDIRSLVPLDTETIINSVIKTGRAIVIHEAAKTGGFGGEIVSSIVDSEAFFYLEAPVKRLCGLDVPIPYNPKLEAEVVPSEDKIKTAVKALLKEE